MLINDYMPIDASGLVFTKDGYLIGDAKIARAGNVQDYYGYELGLTGDDANKIFGVYRDPEAVFDANSMLSLAGRPVTRGHPAGGVNADNWKELAKGQVGGVIRRDGEHVVAPMAIMDAVAAKEVHAGARSLSAGYTAEIIADSGIAPDGKEYQFKQIGEIRFNHVAYLPDNNPRAGNTRIGDAAEPGNKPIKQEEVKMTDTLKTVVLGDKAVQVTASDVAAIEAFKADVARQLTDAANKHQLAIADKDKELAKKDAELDTLKGKVLSDADLDAAVKVRADLIATAKTIADKDYTGKAPIDIKKLAVTAKLGDAAIAGKSDDYVAARFDILAEDAAKDPVRKMHQERATTTDAKPEAAYADMVNGLQTAYQGGAK